MPPPPPAPTHHTCAGAGAHSVWNAQPQLRQVDFTEPVILVVRDSAVGKSYLSHSAHTSHASMLELFKL